jgi:hypothetical protein
MQIKKKLKKYKGYIFSLVVFRTCSMGATKFSRGQNILLKGQPVS